MIRRLLCWLGWHDWKWICEKCPITGGSWACLMRCPYPRGGFYCKHCGKEKDELGRLERRRRKEGNS